MSWTPDAMTPQRWREYAERLVTERDWALNERDIARARLAEAERLLSLAYDGELWGPLYNDYLNRKSNSRTPDSAPASPYPAPQCDTCGKPLICDDCNI